MKLTAFYALVRDARDQLSHCLESGSGRKALVIDKSLSGIISRLADSAFIKEHGVERLSYLSPQVPDLSDCHSVIYIARPDPDVIKLIGQHVHGALASARDASGPTSSSSGVHTPPVAVSQRFFLFCLPRSTLLVKKILEDDSLLAEIDVQDLEIDLLPLEHDLFSMEYPSFHALAPMRDSHALYQLSSSLLALESAIGPFTAVRGRGPLADSFMTMFTKMRAAHSHPSPVNLTATNRLILVDRTLDMITPLMTQFTYTGLVDTFKDIVAGFVEVDGGGQRPRKFKLSMDDDNIYCELADLNFGVVGPTLQRLAMELKAESGKRKEANTLTDINKFVSDKLPELQKLQEALPIHIGLAESVAKAIMDEDFNLVLQAQQVLLASAELDADLIDELMCRNYEPEAILALICLGCLIGCVKEKQLDLWKREFVQSYGFHHLVTWHRLEQAGLLTVTKTPTRQWANLRKALDLIVEDVRVEQPDDIAYTFTGYAPLSARLVQHWLRPTARTRDDISRLLPGPPVEVGDFGTAGRVFVLFLGGATYAEVSAVRLLGRTMGADVTVVATEMVNYRRIMAGAMVSSA
ncbi:hypothetical protein GGF32_008970 [Allomyces javanicus]|nr:hypothetical protein GGF32_008970 [Allomyces javanicus]